MSSCKAARRRSGCLAAIGIIGALSAAGCASASGTMTSAGFEHSKYRYRVVGDPKEAFAAEWRLQNFRQTRGGKFEQKSTEFVTKFLLDGNDDGKRDVTVEEPTFDLRYEHLRRDGAIWVRTFPVSGHQRHKELRILMQNYVDEIAGAGYENVSLYEGRVVVERRFAAELVERGDATLAGRPAYVATVDVANIDQIRMSPSRRGARVRLVMLHTDFIYEASAIHDDGNFPVLMMAGYSNLPEDFERDLPSFERFLQQIEIRGKRGWQIANLEKLSPSIATPPTAAPPAENVPAAAPSAAPPAAQPSSPPPASD